MKCGELSHPNNMAIKALDSSVYAKVMAANCCYDTSPLQSATGIRQKMTITPSSRDEAKTERPALPAYVLVRPEGVFIKLSPPPAQDILRLFIERLFADGVYFKGLDYACLQRLLYGNPAATEHGNTKETRLASDILRIPPQRRDLYRAVKIIDDGERAEYMFEPVFIETVSDEPVYGPPGDDGIAPLIETRHIVTQSPTRLDFDEFVAQAWARGVRFGLDADTVRTAIASDAPGRIDIAHQLSPTDSQDAAVIEECDALRQNNAPLILADGRADLRRAKNRFPQIAKNSPLLRKIPRVLGEPGYKVTGAIIEARLPTDLDLSKLGGEGTRIMHDANGELLVADLDGFIILDEKSSGIWISAKIENKGGISAKSTGDIKLDVDEYVEHGEVQEGRVVEGKHMTFHADVFGSVVSQNGDIQLESNLSGGHACSMGGNVSIRGRAFNALIEAWDGKISAEFTENCKIVGQSVSIERAVSCEIIAEEIQIGVAEGCAIAGKQIKIASSDARKDKETIIVIPVPDFSDLDQHITQAKNALDEIRRTLAAKSPQMEAERANPKLAKIMDIADKIRSGAVKLTPDQQTEWQRVMEQSAPIMRESAALTAKYTQMENEIARLSEARTGSGAGESCEIGEVLGETVVRQISTNQGITALRELPAHELTALLRQPASAKDRIFSGHQGRLEWHFTVPDHPG